MVNYTRRGALGLLGKGVIGGLTANTLTATLAAADENFNVNPLAEAVVRDGVTDEHLATMAENRDYFVENRSFAQGRFDYYADSDHRDFSRKVDEIARHVKQGFEPDSQLNAIDNVPLKDFLRERFIPALQNEMARTDIDEAARIANVDSLTAQIQGVGTAYYTKLKQVVSEGIERTINPPAPAAEPAPKAPSADL